MWFDQVDLGYEPAEPTTQSQYIPPAEPAEEQPPAEPVWSNGYYPCEIEGAIESQKEERRKEKAAERAREKERLQNGDSNRLHPQRRRSVGFREEPERHEVEVDPVPLEEMWYSKDEYDDIRSRNAKFVRKCMSGDYDEMQDDDSVRGLEHKMKSVSRARRENKFNALNAVMEEQDRQIMRGVSDPSAIAAAYRSVASRCQDKASQAGLRDAENSMNFRNFTRVRSHDDIADIEVKQDDNYTIATSTHSVRTLPPRVRSHQVSRRGSSRSSYVNRQHSPNRRPQSNNLHANNNHQQQSQARHRPRNHSSIQPSNSNNNSNTAGNQTDPNSTNNNNNNSSQSTKKKSSMMRAVIQGTRRRLRRASM